MEKLNITSVGKEVPSFLESPVQNKPVEINSLVTNTVDVKFQALRKWVLDNGGTVNEKLGLKLISEGNRAVYATDTIQASEPVLKIPDIVCIGRNKIKSVPGIDKLTKEQLDEHASDTLCIVILMYNIFILGEKSFYYPFLNIVPSKEEFAYHPIYQYNAQRRDLWNKISSKVINYIDTHLKKIDLCYNGVVDINKVINLFDEKILTYDNVKWCYMILRTRQWNDPGLVPIADLLQHSNVSNMLLYHDPKSEINIMTSKTAINKNDLIYDNYGIYDDTSLFSGFGFIEGKPELDLKEDVMRIVKLTINTTVDTNKVLGRFKSQELERYFAAHKNFFASNKGLCTWLIEYLRIAALSESDMKLIAIESTFYDKMISMDNEAKVYSWILSVLATYDDVNEKHLGFCKNICETYDANSIEYQMAKLNIIYVDTVKKTIELVVERWNSFITNPFETKISIKYPK